MLSKGSDSKDIYWICPLYSFECECDSADLDEGIQIARAPDECKKHIYERSKHLYGLWEDPSKFDWAIFVPYRRTNVEGLSRDKQMTAAFKEQDRDTDSLVDVFTALRLCDSGRVLAGPMFSASVDGSSWSVGGTTIWTRVSEKNFIIEDTKYVLTTDRLTEVSAVFKELRLYREKGVLEKMNLTLRRFHSSYTGPIEDRLIDQMIAFESLYLSDAQELTYKLAMRVAFLLGDEPEERPLIFGGMKKAYRYRSSIVHGDEPPNRDELGVITTKTEEYLRRSIRAFLVLLAEGKSLKQIRESLLDENIVRGGNLLSGS